MAYIKIFPIKVTDKKALDYITNPDKTDEKLLVSSFGCSPETADLEFAMTREHAKKNGMDKGDNLAFHLIQSFKPGETDEETAHRLEQQFADEVLKGKYEYVISTHVDKNHIHNHIIFNATSFVDHHKYVSNKRSYHKLCRISNRICHENGLATSMPTGEKGKSYKENMEYHRGTSWKAKLRVAVDKAIWTSINYEEFLQKMQLAGYEVRQGKHLSFRAPEQKNFTYMKSLGSYYSEENVRIRLAKNRNKVKTPKHGRKDVLGMYVGENESAKFWLSIMNGLKNRGVEDILITCVDGLNGFPQAIEAVYPKTEIQQCIIHQIRNSTKFVSYKDIKKLMADLKLVYAAPTEETALNELELFKDKWDSKYPKIYKSWHDNWATLSTYFKYPEAVRRLIYTTNAIEGFNRQLRKVTKSKTVFPSDDSLLKMLYLATMDITKKWTGHRQDWGQIHSQLEIYFEERLIGHNL